MIACVYPTGFCANMTALIKGAPGFSRAGSLGGSLVGFVTGYVVLVAVVASARPDQVLAFRWPAFLPLVLLAPFVGLLCIVAEYLVGVLVLAVRTRRLVLRATVHDSYAAFSRIAATDVLSVLVVVVGEELVLRQLLFELSATELGLGVGGVIALCTAAYAVNHLAFGAASAIAKVPSGLLYVWLYYVSGLSVVVVIVAHATQNLALLALSRRTSWTAVLTSWTAIATSRAVGRRSREVSEARWR